jgi:hypothetical protein
MTVERSREHKQDEPARERSRGVAQAGQLVGHNEEPRRQAGGPGFFVFAVDGQRILAADRQQAFTTIFESAFVESLASEMRASGLPISGWSPKFVERLANVGAARWCAPSNPVSTRPMVPLPPRFGPTMRNTFCSVVSPPSRLPKISCSAWIVESSAPQFSEEREPLVRGRCLRVEGANGSA